jgi:hypothetical protein
MGIVGSHHRPQLYELSLNEWRLDEEPAADREFRVLHTYIRCCFSERWQVIEAQQIRYCCSRPRHDGNTYLVLLAICDLRQPDYSGGRPHRICSDVAHRKDRASSAMVHLDYRIRSRRDRSCSPVEWPLAGSCISGHVHVRSSRGRASREARTPNNQRPDMKIILCIRPFSFLLSPQQTKKPHTLLRDESSWIAKECGAFK